MSDLVGNPEDRFSHSEAQICLFVFLSSCCADNTMPVSVGENIELSVILKTLNGKKRTRGGDKLHVRIINTSFDAYAPGFAIDHDNGTYTAVVPALWPGQSVVSMQLAYPRELIRAFYVTKRQVRSEFSIVLRKPAFSNAKIKTKISCAVTAQLISAFVFAIRIVQSIPLLNKSEISSL